MSGYASKNRVDMRIIIVKFIQATRISYTLYFFAVAK